MNARTEVILSGAREAGWVLEPRAKELLSLYGLPVSRNFWAKTRVELAEGAEKIGFPLAAKVVSPQILHKSDSGGVAVGVANLGTLQSVFDRMSALPGFEGVLLDEMVKGVELIVGAKTDPQFGAVVLVGIGGTSVEIYKDVAIRMAPLTVEEAAKALSTLKGWPLLDGYRGAAPVNHEKLAGLIAGFSALAFELGGSVESIDLNPVFCDVDRAIIADARIMLPKANNRRD